MGLTSHQLSAISLKICPYNLGIRLRSIPPGKAWVKHPQLLACRLILGVALNPLSVRNALQMRKAD
ncbi:MAG: hypothetical protein F6K54_29405 [Okeania sp. SIO3B5]|uniref:hypothetical protein n=1 Tax=Okeania sp. SIO3B5 TaxID=2607811 RepID=UPI001400A4D1|nr:hypothetical protein [Okeania sp. SIO3B5]NEO56829.1 hypothetical protein [Okeania sp. SIO3B5]